MPWFWSKAKTEDDAVTKPPSIEDLKQKAQETSTSLRKSPTSNILVSALTEPRTLLGGIILASLITSVVVIQRRFLRRYQNAPAVPPAYILPNTRRFTRSLFGRVTRVGDGDNFRLFHTPLGRFGLWESLRRVPEKAKDLKDNTIHIRLAGIDAPELSHFGKPAQPYGKEALDWLTSYLVGRRVRCYVHKADQYSRVVATVYVRKGLLRRDVGLQMLRAGLATVYESKSGAEFGGEGKEEKYRAAEEWAKRKRNGMWASGGTVETPREYKNRYNEGAGGAAGKNIDA